MLITKEPFSQAQTVFTCTYVRSVTDRQVAYFATQKHKIEV